MAGISSLPSFLASTPAIPIERCIHELEQGEAEGSACAVFADVDEAAHGLYALLKNVGTGAVSNHATLQMNLASHGALASSLAFEPMVRGAGPLTGMIASSAVVAPAAGFAMYAGMQEWRGSVKHAKLFAQRQQLLDEEAKLGQKLAPHARQQLLTAISVFDSAAASRVLANARFARASKIGGLIGKYSFLSGAAIMARIVVELIRNVGGVTQSGDVDANQAAKQRKISSAFLTGTGLASNALAGIASGLAVMLGINFVRKTGVFKAKWQADQSNLALKRHALANSQSPYGRFLVAKGRDRLEFLRGFHAKNIFFLAGTALYAAGTILPTCVKLLAAAGILSSKKVGAALIMAMFATGVAGALAMGIFSHQFFYGHPKLGRYEEYGFKDTPLLDRRFLSNIDTFVFLDAAGQPRPAEFAVKTGLAQREAAFSMIQASESARNALLSDIAGDCGREFRKLAHVGDPEYDLKSSRSTKLKARFGRNRLRLKDVSTWLQSPQNQLRLHTYFQSRTEQTVAYLTGKAQLHKQMHEQILSGAADASDETARTKFAHAMFGSYSDTVALLEKMSALSAKFEEAADTLRKGSTSRLHLPAIEEALAAFATEEDDEQFKKLALPERVAKSLLEIYPAQHNHNRGKLLEIELQANEKSTPAKAVMPTATTLPIVTKVRPGYTTLLRA